MTTPAEELAEQRRWKLKPQFAALRDFDELVENEFLAPAEQLLRQARSLRTIVRFAAAHTPYWANLFARLGLRPQDIDTPEDLVKLPVLTKQDVLAARRQLLSRWLPPAERTLIVVTRSSGTTGRPVEVAHSYRSAAMFGLLRQRNCRWFRADPTRPRLDFLAREDVPRGPDGKPNPDGAVVRLPGWSSLDRFFETGPAYAFNVSSPIEQHVALLRQLRPSYAMTYPGIFEEWLLHNEGQTPVDSLEAIFCIGSQLTPSLRRRLGQGFGIPVHDSYGLNEIGLVAVRCPAGRYHVHSEHCLVQIVDAEGQPCPPGQAGHVLVTGFSNFVMPLIRYDTGDLAAATSGPCACGRTSPAFGEISGRFRRFAGLPARTRDRFYAIQDAVESHRPAELAFMRQFQVHQDRENRFTVRLRTVGPIPESFRAAVLRAWEPVAGTPPLSLAIVAVDAIEASPSGKLLDFMSDLHTDGAVAPQPQR